MVAILFAAVNPVAMILEVRFVSRRRVVRCIGGRRLSKGTIEIVPQLGQSNQVSSGDFSPDRKFKHSNNLLIEQGIAGRA
jgi:hypothetical protein